MKKTKNPIILEHDEENPNVPSANTDCLKRIRGYIAYNNYVLFDGTEKEYTGKHRAYFVCTYKPLEELQELLQPSKTWAFIAHDKDDKKLHNHFIVVFDNAKHVSTLCKFFSENTDLQTFFSVAHDVKLCFDYMLHRDKKSRELKKHLYDVEEVLTEDISYFDRFNGKTDKVAKEAKNEEFMNDLMRVDINLKEMAIKYGRDFMKNYKSYMDFRRILLNDIVEAEEDETERIFKLAQDVREAWREAEVIFAKYNLEFTDRAKRDIKLRIESGSHNFASEMLLIELDIESGYIR